MLKAKLKDDLKNAMLARDEVAVSTLRMLISAIGYYEIQKGSELSEAERDRLLDKRGSAGYEATDEDVTAVIQKEVKQRRDSIEQFMAGGREDLVGKETREMAVLEKYLPEQMSEEDIKKLVDDAISRTGATGPQDMGKVMGALMPQTKGKADGTLVSKLVKEKLSS